MTALARTTSILLHPVATVTLAVVLSTRAGDSLLPVVGIALVMAVPLLVFIQAQVRRGVWENVDASRPAERHSLYAAGAVIVIASASWFYFTGSHGHARGAIAVGGMIAVAYGALRWIKLSLHMAFGAYATGILLSNRPAAGVVMLLLLPALAWSRLHLQRHSFAEVVGGTILGAVTAAVVVFAL